MSPKNTLSYSAALILQAVANSYRYGFDIMDVTGLPSGTIYPALRRMEEAGLVRSRWETENTAHREGRPARKYYEITDPGHDALVEALKRYRLLEQLMPKEGEPSPKRG
jgi:PadR family transcriptional regulator, regulatory protein PadR